MTCIEFDKAFDPYVDGLLDPTSALAARMHVESCRECERMVARWQQSRILLSTAVAEIASAVDVSGLFDAVEASLPQPAEAAHASSRRRARRERQLPAGREGIPVRVDHAARAVRPAAGGGRFVALRRFATVAGATAAAAAASILLLTSGTSPVVQLAGGPSSNSVAPSPSPSFHNSQLPWVKPVSLGASQTRSDKGTWRPLLPPPALVDALEAGEGHTVSTWVQPRTQARVIWVQSRQSGPTIQETGYDR